MARDYQNSLWFACFLAKTRVKNSNADNKMKVFAAAVVLSACAIAVLAVSLDDHVYRLNKPGLSRPQADIYTNCSKQLSMVQQSIPRFERLYFLPKRLQGASSI